MWSYILSAVLLLTGGWGTLVRGDYPPSSERDHGIYLEPSADSWSQPDLRGGSLGGPSAKCIDIPANLSLCRGIGYGQMRLPNLLEHDTIREVTTQASSWVQLLSARCHADTQVFLCSLFAPICLEQAILPCRSLCEAVKSGCEQRMLMFGYPWPEMLRCDKFPTGDELCIARVNGTASDGDETCSACSQSETYEVIVDNFCRAEFAIRVTIDETLMSGSDLKIIPSMKKKIFRIGALKAKDMRDSGLFLEQAGTNCNCTVIESSSNGRRSNVSYLIMGSMMNKRLVISMIQPFKSKSKEMSLAMKTIKKGANNICKKNIIPLKPKKQTKNNKGGKKRKLPRMSASGSSTASGKSKSGGSKQKIQIDGNKLPSNGRES